MDGPTGPSRPSPERSNVHDDADATASTSEWLAWSLFDGTPSCLLLLGLDGRVLAVNRPAPTPAASLPAGEVRGLDWREALGAPQDGPQDGPQPGVLDVARRGEVARIALPGTIVDGAPTWWDVSIGPVIGRHGDVVRLLVVARPRPAPGD
jgi:hypothetical protein